MPEEQMRASFFDAPRILAALGFAETSGNVADFGCGYSRFTVAAAGLTTGTVFAFDIEREMIESTAHKAQLLGLHNVRAAHRNLFELGSGLGDDSLAYAMLSKLREAFRTMALDLRQLHATWPLLEYPTTSRTMSQLVERIRI